MKLLKKLPPLKRRERSIEYSLRDELKDEYDIMFVKLKPTIEGFPDRLAIGWKGMRLVELKREGDVVEKGSTQDLMHQELARHGIQVLTFGGRDVKWIAECIDLSLRRRR